MPDRVTGMVRAVVFDVGETLIDETRIWTRWADRLGVPALTFLGVLGGCAALDLSHRHAFEMVRPDLDVPAVIERWAADDPAGLRENFDADDLYPDVREALAALRACGGWFPATTTASPAARTTVVDSLLELPALLAG